MWRSFMNAILAGFASTAPALAAEAGGLSVPDFSQDSQTDQSTCGSDAGAMAEPDSRDSGT